MGGDIVNVVYMSKVEELAGHLRAFRLHARNKVYDGDERIEFAFQVTKIAIRALKIGAFGELADLKAELREMVDRL